MVALSVFFMLVGCGSSVSWELLKGDCRPTGEEVWYDGVDQDCDGNDDDQDGDGISVDADCWDDPNDGTFLADAVGAGHILTAAEVYPGAEDAWYDGVDQNCDGANDFDQDGDGFESANDEKFDGSVGDDCVDGSPNDEVFEDSCSGELITVDPADAASVNPDATDTFYDGVDQNCDGDDDNDADGDGYAVCNECDDTDPDTFPSDIPEVWYDCQDQNCDSNDGDRDGDGYVDAEYTASCADWATINPGKQDGDCNDSAATAYPGGSEVCDASNVDEDCDGLTDDNDPSVSSSTKIRYYKDADGDGYGSSSDTGALSCDATATYKVTANSDCDDSSSSTNPGVSTDTCWNGVDNDCDDVIDEGSSSSQCYSGGELVISEIMYYSLGAVDPDGEFFEVYNPSSTKTVYMETMQIVRKSTSSSTVTIYVSDSIAVAPTDTVVLCYSDVSLGSTCDYIYGSDQGFSEPLGNSFDSNFTMSNNNANTTLTITATSNHVSADVLLDSVNYDASGGGGWPSTFQGYSFELKSSKLNSTSNNTGSNWCRTTASAYYAPGALKDYGTPNATNTCL